MPQDFDCYYLDKFFLIIDFNLLIVDKILAVI